MKVLLTLVTLAVVPLVLSGCNTVEGMGKDIERAGESIQKL
ncbi:MAG TPA: entericidin A/B family lipoprotein [Alphaproteobacteria bacterium]|nr:entericidin A/B family lipoprotein [Alphaproteobacteria bacterium]USO05174.1 MAG: entericidin A/B family lipoprotein [Rhodospirillales bacterium]HOO82102.1 entericidin A/B family lipoprotein [Alphaproteobacteria bacterium]